MPWLLKFMDEIISDLPDDLNAQVIQNEELEVSILELDGTMELCRKKKNPQWLWLVFHRATRQVLAMHVGKRDKATAEWLLAKLPEDFKKKAIFYTDKFSVYYETIPWIHLSNNRTTLCLKDTSDLFLTIRTPIYGNGQCPSDQWNEGFDLYTSIVFNQEECACDRD